MARPAPSRIEFRRGQQCGAIPSRAFECSTDGSPDEIEAVNGDKKTYGAVYLGFAGSGYAHD